ncbi:endonuclease/exonuclease/phosphatase family protein [Trifolium medium]|uniref:Endonuclease/exonuclease/phosphatase family protein n=1 Tax=Trifolium medium TaxID=97028 RepID=A0A392NDV8_9FABA|nr:endonuclease/exonuclease/phosphatase family protein [Trifolium medium]
MGDFNDMLSADDKRGGTTQPPWLIRGFKEAVQDSGLIDLPMEGYPFTWTKGRRALNPTEERLDRALATQRWLDEFPYFKFKEQELNHVVSEAWNKEGHAPLLSKIKNCTEDLEVWGARLRSRFTRSIREYREEMEQNQDSSNDLCVRKYQEAREKLSKVLKQEEEYWKQRSKIHWLRDGDSNTKFFHAMASARRRRNHITKLSNNDGDLVHDQSGMCNIAKEYFDNLFQQGDK